MPFGSGSGPMLGNRAGIHEVFGRFTGGGAATNCAKVARAVWGITSVAYNAGTGLYLITFDAVEGRFLGGTFHVMTASGAANRKVAGPVGNHAYSHSARTLAIEVTTLAATPAAADLATTEELWIRALWATHEDS